MGVTTLVYCMSVVTLWIKAKKSTSTEKESKATVMKTIAVVVLFYSTTVLLGNVCATVIPYVPACLTLIVTFGSVS
ncbi:hypothetical protein L596_013074 [Steinernema carpocapsae]|uniref:Uncharacterized protein n=1 Tax=Steinernema carpocapsae TaxID=34508 RepID=A0A4U5NZA5_STECR|nr:hypothetical protein L596_013074 [Steinernema carpocapsae]